MTKYIIKLFYADWCPHCINFKPHWEKLKEFIKNNTTLKDSKNNNITISTSEYSDADNSMEMELEKITSFPTIIIYKNDEERDIYRGKPSFDGLIKYLNIANSVQTGGKYNMSKNSDMDYYKKYLKYKTKYAQLKHPNY